MVNSYISCRPRRCYPKAYLLFVIHDISQQVIKVEYTSIPLWFESVNHNCCIFPLKKIHPTEYNNYTMKMTTTLWRWRLHYEDDDYAMKMTTTLWRWRLRYEDDDYAMKMTTALWRWRLHYEDDDYAMKMTTTLWRWRLHYEGDDYTMKMTTTLWRWRLRYEDYKYADRCLFTKYNWIQFKYVLWIERGYSIKS